MKQPLQARLTAAQIRAIRRKRQQGWTPRQIEEDTGVDHVTVWRHTRNIRPNKEETPEEARFNGQGPILAPVPIPAPATAFSKGPSQMSAVAYQYTPEANLSQPTPVQTPLQLLSPQQKPGMIEYVVERKVVGKEHKDWYDKFREDDDRYFVRDLKRAKLKAELEKYEQARRQIERQAMAEH